MDLIPGRLFQLIAKRLREIGRLPCRKVGHGGSYKVVSHDGPRAPQIDVANIVDNRTGKTNASTDGDEKDSSGECCSTSMSNQLFLRTLSTPMIGAITHSTNFEVGKRKRGRMAQRRSRLRSMPEPTRLAGASPIRIRHASDHPLQQGKDHQ